MEFLVHRVCKYSIFQDNGKFFLKVTVPLCSSSTRVFFDAFPHLHLEFIITHYNLCQCSCPELVKHKVRAQSSRLPNLPKTSGTRLLAPSESLGVHRVNLISDQLATNSGIFVDSLKFYNSQE